MNDELCFTAAVDLARRIRARELSPVEVIEAVLERVERLNPVLNAFITVSAEQARQAARAAEETLMHEGPGALGPLAGLPISIKDLTPTAGVRTTYGVLTHADHVPEVDAPVWARIRRAGGALIGKTSTPAFGWLGVTENELTGTTNNPWAPGCSVGGSSGGAAAAVAAGLGQLATGSDGGGSIRVPAALCGIVGLKPSCGRVPRGPESPLFETVDVLGPMTRTVADAALILSVIAGPTEDEPYMLPEEGVDYVADLRAAAVRGLRVAFSADLGCGVVDPEVAAIIAQAVQHFERALAAQVTAISLEIPDPVDYFLTYYSPLARIFANAQPSFVAALDERYPGAAALTKAQGQTLAHDWWQAVTAQRERTFLGLARVFSTHDVLITPTLPVCAWPHNRELGPSRINDREVKHPNLEFFRFTEPFGHSGHPAITINCGFTSAGLPVGLQIVGRQRDDRTVLRAAAAYEATTPWRQRRPSIARAPAHAA